MRRENETVAGVARALGVSRQTVYSWLKNGCPRNPDGSLDLERVLAWRRASGNGPNSLPTTGDDPGIRAASARTALQAKRLALQCEKLELDLLLQRGRLHDKEACALSLASVVNEYLQPLLTLHGRVKQEHPDVPDAVVETIAREVENILTAIRNRLLTEKTNAAPRAP